MFQTTFVEKNKTHILCWVASFFLQIVPLMRQCGKIQYSYKHTLRVCNIYCYPTATMIPQTPLNVTFTPGLSPKIPNNFNILFSDLLWSYWASSPATWSSPIFILCSQRFVRFCKCSSSSEFSLISRTDSIVILSVQISGFGHFFSSTYQAFFSSLPLSASSSPSGNNPRSPSGHEVEIRDELYPHNQNKQSQRNFHFGQNVPCFLEPG